LSKSSGETMRLYYGTNTNALDNIAKEYYRLLSRREMFKRRIPLFSGDYDSLIYQQGKRYDIVTFNTDVNEPMKIAKAPFSYSLLKEAYKNEERRLKEDSNLSDKDKMMILFNKNHLAYSLKVFQKSNRKKREELFTAQPVLFEFMIVPYHHIKESYSIFSITTEIYTSLTGFDKVNEFYKDRWKNFDPLTLHKNHFLDNISAMDDFLQNSIQANIDRLRGWPKLETTGALSLTFEQDQKGGLTLT
jgi:hypothetical protein